MSARAKGPTNKWGPLPLVVGVSGHRDIRDQDRATLERGVREIFSELRRRCPSTPLLLLSPLAEGADRLAASVALECGARLAVPLPMPQALYERDFQTAESRRECNELLAKAEKHFELPLVEGNTQESIATPGDARNRQYAQVGAYIARHSQILIALWDGEPTTKVGGTAQVVAFRRAGIPEPYVPPRSPLDAVEAGPVYHIVTPRTSNPQPRHRPFTLIKLFPSSFETEAAAKAAHARILKRFEGFNRDCLRLGERLTKRRTTGQANGVPHEEQHELSVTAGTNLAWYAADSLALHFQRLTHRTVWALLLLAAFGATCVQINAAGLAQPLILDILYVGALLAVGAVYLGAWWGEFHNKYLDYRALAEGLRVHLFWRLARVREPVADHYLRKHRGELQWIRQALRVWDIRKQLDRLDDEPRPDRARLQMILERWVSDQAAFYARAAGRNHKTARRIRAFGIAWFVSGIVLALVKALPVKNDHPLLVGMSLVMVVAALSLAYGRIMAFSEQAKQYDRMQLVFGNAARQLNTWIAADQCDDARGLIRELGQEALTENADWVLLHRERPPEPR